MLYFRTLVDTVYSLKDQVKALEQVSIAYTCIDERFLLKVTEYNRKL